MSELLMIMMALTFMVTKFLTPLKVTLFIILSSIMVSMSLYWKMNEMFPPSAVTLSFSSGMMILFCYCAMLTPFEGKSKSNSILKMFPPTVIFLSFLHMSEKSKLTQQTKSGMNTMEQSPLIMVAMGVVILSMVSINSSMFNPSKPLTSSY